jgi:hypothetical protein
MTEAEQAVREAAYFISENATVSRLSDRSISTRSRLILRSLISITVIERHAVDAMTCIMVNASEASWVIHITAATFTVCILHPCTS